MTSDQRPDDDEVNLGDFPKAQMAIAYRPDVLAAWSQAQHLPTEYLRRFLEALDEDPKCDALEALSAVEEEFKKEQRPFDDEAANDALEQVRTICPEAALEFKNVYETFGDTVPLAELIQRIEDNYGPSEETIAMRDQERREEKIRLKQERREAQGRLEQQRREQGRLEQGRLERDILLMLLVIGLAAVALWA